MKRGDPVICKYKSELNHNDKLGWYWDFIDIKGIILLSKESSLATGLMYLVKLDNDKQLYFYQDLVELDKLEVRNNTLKKLGI